MPYHRDFSQNEKCLNHKKAKAQYRQKVFKHTCTIQEVNSSACGRLSLGEHALCQRRHCGIGLIPELHSYSFQIFIKCLLFCSRIGLVLIIMCCTSISVLVEGATTEMMTDMDMTTEPETTVPDNGSSHLSITLLGTLLLAVLALLVR